MSSLSGSNRAATSKYNGIRMKFEALILIVGNRALEGTTGSMITHGPIDEASDYLQTLPNELFSIILGYVHAEDTYATRCCLANLRLTCRVFADVVAPRYFKTIPLWVSLKSLQDFTALSATAQM